jgi:hypothetical protein
VVGDPPHKAPIRRGAQQAIQGAFGPDRQWLQTAAVMFDGIIAVYAEDGVTPLAAGPVNLGAGTAYHLELSSNKATRAK